MARSLTPDEEREYTRVARQVIDRWVDNRSNPPHVEAIVPTLSISVKSEARVRGLDEEMLVAHVDRALTPDERAAAVGEGWPAPSSD